MSSSPLSMLNPASRSLEWVAGSGALLSSTALSTGQLASLGPIVSLIEGTLDTSSGTDGVAPLDGTLVDAANGLVLDTHAQLEDVGHEVTPLNGPLHGLTNLGETIGLGHIGEGGNLITDLSGVVANPTDVGAATPLFADAGHITDAAGALLDTTTALPAAGNGVVGSGSVLTPATEILNQGILDLHTTLEDVGHSIPELNAPIHAVTSLGETIGLGHIGEPGNLLSDTLVVPGSILTGGGLASADPVLSDLGHVLGATDTLLDSATGAANAGSLLSSGGLLAPVTNIANTAVLDFHTTLEDLGHNVPLLNDTLHGLTNLGETIGLGHIGEGGNLLTDAAGLPGDVLGGQGLGALSPILNDAGAVTTAAGGLVNGVTATVDGLAGTGQASVGALLGTALQPAGDVANGLANTVQGSLEQVGHSVPALNDPLHAVAGLGNTAGLGELGTAGNLVTDAVNLPGAALAGNGVPAAGQIASDIGHVTDTAGSVLGAVTASLPTAGTGEGSGTHLGDVLTPVTTALGPAESGAAGNTVGQLLGSLSGDVAGGTAGGSGTGTHPLVDVSAGPTTTAPAADVAVLTPSSDQTHTVQVSAVSVGADQPSLATANLLGGDSISLPQTTGGGADALVGQLANAVSATPSIPADAGASHATSVDLGVAAVDLGGHTDVQHTDPTPHTATSGLHLLGL